MGGRDQVGILSDPIDAGKLILGARSDACGALACFVGVVRDHHKGRRVHHLEYEAYAPMAEAEMRRVVEEARARWTLEAMTMVHRVGRLEIGEASVAVVTAAAHRGDAIAACEYGIEQLKKRVPIWKKEFFEGGEEWVLGDAREP